MCEENYFSFCLEYLFLTFCVNRHITKGIFFYHHSAYQFSLENNGTRAGVHWAPVPGV